MGCKVSSTAVTSRLDTCSFTVAQISASRPIRLDVSRPVTVTVRGRESQVRCDRIYGLMAERVREGSERSAPIKISEGVTDGRSPDLMDRFVDGKNLDSSLDSDQQKHSIAEFEDENYSLINKKSKTICSLKKRMNSINYQLYTPQDKTSHFKIDSQNSLNDLQRKDKKVDWQSGSDRERETQMVAQYLRSASCVTTTKLDELRRQMQITKQPKAKGDSPISARIFSRPDKKNHHSKTGLMHNQISQPQSAKLPQRAPLSSINILDKLSDRRQFAIAKSAGLGIKKVSELRPGNLTRLGLTRGRETVQDHQTDGSVLDSHGDGFDEYEGSCAENDKPNKSPPNSVVYRPRASSVNKIAQNKQLYRPSQFSDGRKLSLKTNALTGESYSQIEVIHKPSIFSQGSAKSTIAQPSTLENDKKIVLNKKSLFKLAHENRTIGALERKVFKKPLSIVQDSREFTNSIESPTKPVSRFLFNNQNISRREDAQLVDAGLVLEEGRHSQLRTSPKLGQHEQRPAPRPRPIQSSLVVRVGRLKNKSKSSSEDKCSSSEIEEHAVTKEQYQVTRPAAREPSLSLESKKAGQKPIKP